MKELLLKILKENNINHSQFARDLDISRAYVVSMLKGTKPLTEKIYNRLITLNYISGKDKEDISNEYFKVKHSAKTLELIKCFLDLGKDFTFEPVSNVTAEFAADLTEKAVTLDKDGIIKTACSLLNTALQENLSFCTNYSFCLEELDNALYAYYKNKYNPDCPLFDHVITLPEELDRESIISYWKCLKWGSLRAVTSVIVSQQQNNIMPYYIVCKNAVLIFSEDMSKGTAFISPEIAQYYIQQHMKISETAHKGITIIHDESELLTGQDFVSPKYIKSLSTYICPMNVLDYDMLYRTTAENPEPIKDALINAYINYYGRTKALNILYVYYTNDALENFMKTGLLYNVSEKYLHEFSVEDRVRVLKNIVDNGMFSLMKSGTADFYRGYDASVTDKSLITHFALTYPGHTDYEIYMCVDKSKYHGAEDFTKALFEYVEMDNHICSREQAGFVISQLQAMGGIYDSTAN